MDSARVLAELLRRRRSIRSFAERPVEMEKLLYILWAGYCCIDRLCSRRTSPSAGATYPIELYAVARRGGVEGLGPGVYLYDGRGGLEPVSSGDYTGSLYEACLRQRWVREAPVNIIVAARPEKTTRWYGARGIRYVYMEAGHVGQNIYLAAAATGLGTVAVGAFSDEEIASIIGGARPLYVFPLGYPRLPLR